MSDLISRQAAIDAVLAEVEDRNRPNTELRWWNMGMTRASVILEQLPPAEPKMGRWISDRLVSTNGGTYGIRRCSECEAYYQDIGYGWNYCPNCGSRMEEPADE